MELTADTIDDFPPEQLTEWLLGKGIRKGFVDKLKNHAMLAAAALKVLEGKDPATIPDPAADEAQASSPEVVHSNATPVVLETKRDVIEELMRTIDFDQAKKLLEREQRDPGIDSHAEQYIRCRITSARPTSETGKQIPLGCNGEIIMIRLGVLKSGDWYRMKKKFVTSSLANCERKDRVYSGVGSADLRVVEETARDFEVSIHPEDLKYFKEHELP